MSSDPNRLDLRFTKGLYLIFVGGGTFGIQIPESQDPTEGDKTFLDIPVQGGSGGSTQIWKKVSSVVSRQVIVSSISVDGGSFYKEFSLGVRNRT